MKKVLALFLTGLLSIFLIIPAYAASGDTIVHITNSGTKYHNAGCRTLQSDIPISLINAVSMGYTACAVCNPPALTDNGNTVIISTPQLSAEQQQQLLLQQAQAQALAQAQAQALAQAQAQVLAQAQAQALALAQAQQLTQEQAQAFAIAQYQKALADQQNAAQAALLTQQMQMFSKEVYAVQERLKLYGLYDGDVNGIYDAKTQQAVAIYQISYGLPVDGLINPQIIYLLAQ